MDDRRIIRYSKVQPSASSFETQKGLNLDVSAVTIRRRLLDKGLHVRSPRKVPLMTKKHTQKRLQFAKDLVKWPVEKWSNILWTDEIKFVLFVGTGSRQYVQRPLNTGYHPKYTTKTVKHGGSKILVWACFSYYGVGPIYLIECIMDHRVYVNILERTMLPYAEYQMPLKWIFQQDNDPKHTSRAAKEWFRVNGIEVMV